VRRPRTPRALTIDIGDYRERSDQGWYPVNMSNDAYNLATNYIVYALTH
jgi:hypothetical protein